MARPKDEPLEKTLSRMARSALPAAARKGGKVQQKKGPTAAAAAGSAAVVEKQGGTATATTTAEQLIAATALFPPTSSSSSPPRPIPGETPNGDAWPLAAGGTLRVGERAFSIIVNPPTVLRLSLSAAALPVSAETGNVLSVPEPKPTGNFKPGKDSLLYRNSTITAAEVAKARESAFAAASATAGVVPSAGAGPGFVDPNAKKKSGSEAPAPAPSSKANDVAVAVKSTSGDLGA
jgi:hypothetical protein